MKKLQFAILGVALCIGLVACDTVDYTTQTEESSSSSTEDGTVKEDVQKEEGKQVSVKYDADNVIDDDSLCTITTKGITVSGEENSSNVTITAEMVVSNKADSPIKFIAPYRIENLSINDKTVVEEPSGVLKEKDGQAYEIKEKEDQKITTEIQCELLDGLDITTFSETDTLKIEIAYGSSYSEYQPTFMGAEIVLGTDKVVMDETSTEEQIEDDYITSENPVDFENFGVIECGDVDFTINKLRVCADMSNPKGAHNFYYLMVEYTVKNNASTLAKCRVGKGGNVYGIFKYEEYERYLGGNNVIKDNDFIKDRNYYVELAEGEEQTYSMCLIVDRTIEDPEDGLMLKTNSKMEVVLPFDVNGDKWDLTYTLN